MHLQPGEKRLTPGQQAAMYREIVERDANKLASHYQRMCVETNNTWPGYQQDCYQAALTEMEVRYA